MPWLRTPQGRSVAKPASHRPPRVAHGRPPPSLGRRTRHPGFGSGTCCVLPRLSVDRPSPRAPGGRPGSPGRKSTARSALHPGCGRIRSPRTVRDLGRPRLSQRPSPDPRDPGGSGDPPGGARPARRCPFRRAGSRRRERLRRAFRHGDADHRRFFGQSVHPAVQHPRRQRAGAHRVHRRGHRIRETGHRKAIGRGSSRRPGARPAAGAGHLRGVEHHLPGERHGGAAALRPLPAFPRKAGLPDGFDLGAGLHPASDERVGGVDHHDPGDPRHRERSLGAGREHPPQLLLAGRSGPGFLLRPVGTGLRTHGARRTAGA